jgi:translation initiation factor eIF-2B subunit epsilon
LPQVRSDLIDTNISICSPEVLMMFSDNFDYQSLKRDFVVGTLSEEELGKKIYCHILQVRRHYDELRCCASCGSCWAWDCER